MSFLLDDSSLFKPLFSDVCSKCKHFNIRKMLAGETTPTCKAFPQQIPGEIWSGQNNHTQPYPGDRGIKFERREVQS